MADIREALVAHLGRVGMGYGLHDGLKREVLGAWADAILAEFDVTPRGVHNHDIDPACPETRLPDGSLRGACATDAPPPTVKPPVEALADALAAEGIDAEPGEPDLTPTAERLLALLPGRTEAEVYREGYDQGLRDAASVSRSEATVKAEALREAVRAMRAAWDGSWNLRDPRGPEVAYSVDRWLEVSADRIEKEADRG